MTKTELEHIAASINKLADSIDSDSSFSVEESKEIAAIVSAANHLSTRLDAQNPLVRSKAERMDEIQDVLNAYLLRDFSKTAQLSNAKDNIDAFALSINYFGQDLQESFNRVKEQQRTLKKKNEEILILLKEVNHRVKNNFQIIISLISIQARSLSDPTLVAYFNNIKNRIYSMAQAHEMLHKTKSFSSINCQQYITDISNNIVNSYNDIETHIGLNIDIEDDLPISMDLFTTIGLLINEIITNSVKHAFRNAQNGIINIALKRLDSCNCLLLISDNGMGTAFEVKEASSSIGLTIIEALVEQLDGVCKRESSPQGTVYSITFNTLADVKGEVPC